MTRLPGGGTAYAVIDDYVRQMANTSSNCTSAIDRLDFLPDQAESLFASLRKRKLADEHSSRVTPGRARGMAECLGAPARRTLVHGDYWPGNVLWQRGD